MSIATKVVSSNPAHVEVYSIQHYVIKFVSDLRPVSGFLRVLVFPPPIKLTTTILLKVTLNTIAITLNAVLYKFYLVITSIGIKSFRFVTL